MIVDDPCPDCHGSGRASSARTMQVRIPAGVQDAQRIRLKGKGAQGERGGQAGDLYVTVHVDTHPVFGRKADNLTVTVPVTFPEAALGGTIEVPTLNGPSVKLKLPPAVPTASPCGPAARAPPARTAPAATSWSPWRSWCPSTSPATR